MFNDIDVRETKQNFQKTIFLSTTPGKHIIRILSDKSVKHYTHYLNRATVACLGEGCPLCANNRRLIVEHPENFREIRGWAGQSQRFFVNVLDRTPVKVCPNPECQFENKKNGETFTTNCSSCGALITGVKEAPSNKVKVWSFGVESAGELNSAAKAILDDLNLAPNKYDFSLNVEGIGKEKKVHPVALAHRADEVNVPEDALFDLNSVTIKLTEKELMNLQSGVSLKDIFAARRATGGSTDLDNMASAVGEDTQKRLSDLFKS